MAYPEIMKMLFKGPAVKAAGLLVRAVFMATSCVHMQLDNCVDFLSFNPK